MQRDARQLTVMDPPERSTAHAWLDRLPISGESRRRTQGDLR